MGDKLDSELVKYDQVDIDRYVDQEDAGARTGNATGGAAAFGRGLQPVSQSWLTWNVRLPSRLALLTMACIFVYEVLVAVSMGVRPLRYVMVKWLAWLLLGVNVLLLLILGAIIAYHKVDWSWLHNRVHRATGSAAAADKDFDE